MGRCLCKVIQEGCTIVLIAPVWPAQAWFPILLKCLVEYPVLLPRHCLLLTDPCILSYRRDSYSLPRGKYPATSLSRSHFKQGFQAHPGRVEQGHQFRLPVIMAAVESLVCWKRD